MLEDHPALVACSWLAGLLSVACLYAAAPKRRPRWLVRAALTPALFRAASLCLFVFSVACWMRLENAYAATIIVLWTSALAGSLFVLCAPLYPRAVWTLVCVSAPLLVACAGWEVLHG